MGQIAERWSTASVVHCARFCQGSDLDCQWLDTTDLEAGEYLLRVEINQHRQIAESSYDNNVVVLRVLLA